MRLAEICKISVKAILGEPMLYTVNANIVPRDIGGKYFLVDICAKDYYTTKRIYSVNQVGYTLFTIMKSFHTPFSVSDVLSAFIPKLKDHVPKMDSVIFEDIQTYICDLCSCGYIVPEDIR